MAFCSKLQNSGLHCLEKQRRKWRLDQFGAWRKREGAEHTLSFPALVPSPCPASCLQCPLPLTVSPILPISAKTLIDPRDQREQEAQANPAHLSHRPTRTDTGWCGIYVSFTCCSLKFKRYRNSSDLLFSHQPPSFSCVCLERPQRTLVLLGCSPAHLPTILHLQVSPDPHPGAAGATRPGSPFFDRSRFSAPG